MKVDYPRCPTCQHSLVECKHIVKLIKKIHHSIQPFINNLSTIRSSSSLSPKDLELPVAVLTVVESHLKNSRDGPYVTLLLHVIDLFRRLDQRVESERQSIMNIIYNHVEKSQSIFLTRQQWSDLETEYNRLSLIDAFRAAKEASHCRLAGSDIECLNDVLLGPNPFGRLSCEVCHTFLKMNIKKDDKWKPILPKDETWESLEKNGWVCDENRFVCPAGQ